jgi:hypothetical protein
MRSLRPVAYPKGIVSRFAVLLVGLAVASVVSLARPAHADIDGGAWKKGSGGLDPAAEGELGGAPKLPATGAWFGSNANIDYFDSGTRAKALVDFEELIGRKMAINRVYYTWDEQFPTIHEEWLKAEGRIPLLSWKTSAGDVPIVQWTDVASGMYDATIDARAEDIKAYGGPILFIFHHEPETEGEPEDFIAAYQHIQDRFRAAGVTNVSYVWTLLAYTFRAERADQWYPGDDYVDIVGADGYNWFGCLPGGAEDEWMSFAEVFGAFHDFGVAHDKPMIIAEYGSQEDPDVPGRKAEWITEAAATLKSWPEVKGVSWYNNDAQCVWYVDTSETSLAAYVAMGQDPYFNPPPPLVTIESGPPDIDASDSATFEFSANIPGSTFTCSVDAGNAVPCVSPHTFSGLSEGLHEAKVVATEPTGSKGQMTFSWTVDTVAPGLEINWGPDANTNQTDASFGIESDEQGEGVFLECSLDGAPSSECNVPINYVGLGNGPHTFEATATDGAGNESPPATWAWTVDTTAPEVTITGGPSPLSNSKSATFTMTSSEEGSTFKCSLDGGRYVGCSSPKTYNWLADGTHTFSAKAQDAAKNLSAPKSWTWIVDATKPIVTITSGPGNGPSASVTFAFTASEGSVTFTCQLDSGAKTACTSPNTYSDVALGEHTFSVYATDAAGNVSRTKKWSWRRT